MKLFLLRFHRKIKMNELVCVLLHVFNKSYLTLLTLKSKQLFVFAHKIFPYIQDWHLKKSCNFFLRSLFLVQVTIYLHVHIGFLVVILSNRLIIEICAIIISASCEGLCSGDASNKEPSS